MPALRTGSLHVPVSQKLLFDGIKKLLPGLLGKGALFQQRQEVFLCKRMVIGARRPVVVVKRDVQPSERILHFFVVPVNNGPGRRALLPGAQGDGRPVLIGAANPDDIALSSPQVSDVEIGRQVSPRHVPDVNGTIGIWKGGRDQGARRKLGHGRRS